MNKPRLLVIGHWMYDQIVVLPQNIDLGEGLPKEHIHSPVVPKPGGSGYHFSCAALKAGFEDVTALVCHSDDELSRSMVNSAVDLGVNVVSFESSGKCAQTVLLYDDNHNRVSIGHRGANLLLPKVALEYVGNDEFYDIVFIAGHLLGDNGANDILRKVLQKAYESGSFVVFDLVPHHLYKFLSAEYFRAIIPYIDGIISYEITLRKSFPFLANFNTDNEDEILRGLLKHFEWICMHPARDEIIIAKKLNGDPVFYKNSSRYDSFKYKAGANDIVVAEELFSFSESKFGNIIARSL